MLLHLAAPFAWVGKLLKRLGLDSERPCYKTNLNRQRFISGRASFGLETGVTISYGSPACRLRSVRLLRIRGSARKP
jgi:hypothetical protein